MSGISKPIKVYKDKDGRWVWVMSGKMKSRKQPSAHRVLNAVGQELGKLIDILERAINAEKTERDESGPEADSDQSED